MFCASIRQKSFELTTYIELLSGRKGKLMNAEILCVGTEILLGDIVNTNSAFIARELANIGINVYYQSVVGDNAKRLKDCLKTAFSRVDLVVLTGGLGPTYDDLTKETVADYFGRPMMTDEISLIKLKEYFYNLGHKMTENNLKQAIMPEGAVVFPNEWGTAPGLALSDGNKIAVMLPGPPTEMKPMFETFIVPYLMNLSDKKIVSRTIRLFGIGESQVEDMLYDIMAQAENPTIASYAKIGEVLLRLTASAPTAKEAFELIDPVLMDISQKLSPYIYGIDVPNLQFALVKKAIECRVKIGVAESCTGGLVSEMITQIPGSSDVFEFGACTYANNIKETILGVKHKTLENYGAVSEQTALEMAVGILEKANADIGLSTTGIAGPGGGTKDKPVGIVFIGIATKKDVNVFRLDLSGRRSDDERNNIRYRTAQRILFEALQVIKSEFTL